MSAELPFLAAGAITIAGGAIREKGWPDNTVKAVVATVVLVLVASASNGTKIAPLVRAIGLLFCLTATIATVKAVDRSKGVTVGSTVSAVTNLNIRKKK